MSSITEIAQIIAEKSLELMANHGVLVGLLALLGIFAIVSAIGQKVFHAFKVLFMIFIAIPAVLIVGLFNKNQRAERKKELGEIRAHLKQNPDKWRGILYYILFCIFIIIIVLVVWGFVRKFILPLYELNEVSKQILQNSSNISFSTPNN